MEGNHEEEIKNFRCSFFIWYFLFHRDFSRVPVIQQIMHRRTRFAHIVTETWITECVQVGAILKEQNYSPISDVLE